MSTGWTLGLILGVVVILIVVVFAFIVLVLDRHIVIIVVGQAVDRPCRV